MVPVPFDPDIIPYVVSGQLKDQLAYFLFIIFYGLQNEKLFNVTIFF
jgi:hypothetical protein